MIFCSRLDEIRELSKKFSERGWRTQVLCGNDSELVRADAIEWLAADDGENILDYIISVDIFSEGWEFLGGKIEAGETAEEAIVREIREELDTEIQVEELLDTVEYDYPKFHLSMDCFICTVKSGDLVLKEHEAAKWLTKETLGSVEWLPADEGLIEKIREYIQKN